MKKFFASALFTLMIASLILTDTAAAYNSFCSVSTSDGYTITFSQACMERRTLSIEGIEKSVSVLLVAPNCTVDSDLPLTTYVWRDGTYHKMDEPSIFPSNQPLSSFFESPNHAYCFFNEKNAFKAIIFNFVQSKHPQPTKN